MALINLSDQTSTNPSCESAGSQNDDANLLKRRARVLFVDDVAALRRLAGVVLKKYGADVLAVEDGRRAVQATLERSRKGFGFDVILMDMHMPELDGKSAVIAIRASGYQGTIIALTGNEDEYTRQQCMDAGCDAFATKPITPKKLIELIREAVTGCPWP